MKVINLFEDTKGRTGCTAEHGLSFYIETKQHKLLMDTSASDLLIKNAECCGVDPVVKALSQIVWVDGRLLRDDDGDRI